MTDSLIRDQGIKLIISLVGAINCYLTRWRQQQLSAIHDSKMTYSYNPRVWLCVCANMFACSQ